MFLRKLTSNAGLEFYNRAYVKENLMVNAPYLFRVAYNFLSSDVQSFLILYGYNTNIWKEALLERMEEKQLPKGILQEIDTFSRDNMDGLLQWPKEL